MSLIKKYTMDILFLINVALVIYFTEKQFTRLLVSNEGVSTSVYFFAFTYIVILFILAIKAKKNLPGRVMTQLYILYVGGLIVYGSFLSVVILKWSSWDTNDWITTGIVFACLVILTIVSIIKKVNFTHPYVKGFTGLIVKSVPQLIMAQKIYSQGGSGHNGWAILAFHGMTNIRILQTIIEIKRAGWDKNRKGILISEVGNELAWIIVTIVWLSV